MFHYFILQYDSEVEKHQTSTIHTHKHRHTHIYIYTQTWTYKQTQKLQSFHSKNLTLDLNKSFSEKVWQAEKYLEKRYRYNLEC